MLDLTQWILDLESGTSDLKTCLSEYPDLEPSERFALALAEQKYRRINGLSCDLRHYLEILPELVDSPSRVLELILAQLGPELDTASLSKLERQIEDQIAQLSAEQQSPLRKNLATWNSQALDSERIESLWWEFEDQYKLGIIPRIEHWILKSPASVRSDLLTGFLLSDAYQQQRRNGTIDWPAYIERFPRNVAEVNQAYKDFSSGSSQTRLRSILSSDTGLTSTLDHRREHCEEDILNGRYRLDRILGSGTFGVVFLAYDLKLDRQLAIKVQKKNSDQKQTPQRQIEEAKFAGSLRAENIVPIHNVERDADGDYFIISDYIEGGTLADEIRKKGLSFERIATIVRCVGEALSVAAKKGVIHRDIKPANILIEERTQKVFVTDFGLATREHEYMRNLDPAGSPAYKSPEQVLRGGTKLTGQSDLFSLGIVMYEMLTGKRPFQGESQSVIQDEIVHYSPPPPCDVQKSIPLELDRICMKLLRKNPTERYSDGAELAEDLQAWLNTHAQLPPSKGDGSARLIPRGLRNFTDEDAEAYLQLLPGMCDRDGIPECVTFWTKKIQQRDAEKTFAVGMLLGPSGSGKSSLVKAGIIPRLPPSIKAIHLDATPDDTEVRLLKALQKSLAGLRDTTSLPEALRKIQESQDPKVVIFLDQFEQWLSSNQGAKRAPLIDALLRCDGQSLQAILIVREEFGSATTFLAKELATPFERGHNFDSVELFEPDHARKVLIKFGQAYGRLPENLDSISSSQRKFVDLSVQGLLQDAKGRGVIPVQLALFSDMIQSRPWEPSMLEQVGGTSGVVGNFLDESFSPSNPQCLVHEEDARKLLGALLPVAGSDLKGGRKSLEELQELSGYRGKPTEFRGLCGILEGRLRLIKPSEDQDPSYQLTHDYLVGPLREWLTRKRRETRRGRAELALAECAEVWSIRKESKQLPTMFEWLKIRWHTRVNDWTAPQRAMMKYADRQQWTRLATAGALGAVLLAGGLWYRAYSTVKQLELVDFVRLPTMLEDISSRWDRILLRPGISDRITQSKVPMSKESMSNEPIGQEELKYRLAKLSLDRSDKDNIAVLGKALTTADASQVGIIIKQLEPVREELLESLWVEARRNRADTLLRCASALAKYRPEDQRWDEISKNVTAAVVQENLLDLKHWSNLLTGSRDKLIPHLVSIYKDTGQPRVETEVAASTVLLAEFLDRPRDFQMLHDLMMTGHSDQLAKLFSRYSQFESMAIEELRKELSKAAPTRPADPSDGTSDRTEFVRWQTNKVEHFRRQANAAVSLMKFSRTDSVEDLQKFLTVTDDPEAISQFVHRARGSKIAIETMMLHFNSELARESQESLASNSVERQQHYLRLYAFILALGDYPVSDRNQVEPGKLKGLVDQMHSKYREHPSRAVHSALSWTLRQWGFNDAVKAVDETEIPFDETLRREWFTTKVQLIKSDDGKNTDGEKVNEDYEAALFEPIYFTFLVFGPGEYRMGQSGRRQVRLNKAFALCDREVDWRKLYTINTINTLPAPERPREFWNKPNYPVEVTREFAVQFCVNTTYWGSKSKGHDDSKKDPVDLDYRLPTEAEWEFATRSGSVTPFSFGSDEELVVDYSWCRANARGQTWQVATLRPTISGLFDSHGNLHEYTLDYYHEFAEESSFSEDPVYNKKEDSEVPALRGGSFHQLPMYCSSYQRYFDPPAVKEKLNGVRLAIRFETKGD